jgi:hypothetical protein
MDDDAMIRAMADKNVTQFGRDEYATYREAVTAAAERIMGDVIANPKTASKYFEPVSSSKHDGSLEHFVSALSDGDAPGESIISRYFKGSLSLGPIRMALKEYRESGKLAAWHAKHNPKAKPATTSPKLDSAALGKFQSVVHVKAFADACEEVGLAPAKQARIATHVLKVLQDPEPKAAVKDQSPLARKRNVDWQRTEKPANERLTARNIRRVVTEAIGQETASPAERRRLEAQAHAISIESALSEMAIGLGRAAKAASDLVGVARAIGGMKVDMTPIAQSRLSNCIRDYNAIAVSLREAQQAGPNTGLKRIA